MAEFIVGLIGLGLTAPGLIDAIVRAGRIVERRVSNAQHLDKQIQRFRSFGTNLATGLLRGEIELVQSACSSHLIDQELKDQLDLSFADLISSLAEAEIALTNAEKDGRLKYFLVNESRTERKLRELKEYQTKFSRLAAHAHMQQSRPPSTFLGSRFRLQHETKHDRAIRRLPTSDIYHGRGTSNSAPFRDVILESRTYTSFTKAETETSVAVLTITLQRASSRPSVPTCVGYRQSPFSEAFNMIFELPDSFSRQSLAYMLNHRSRPALEERVALCKLLGQAVTDTHAIGLVHKSIRPHAALVLGLHHHGRSTQLVQLTNWTLVRRLDESSSWIGENEWQRAIYQHPSRQGIQAESGYTIEHDIYSLGVCMLEVLLWKPFVDDVGEGDEDTSRRLSDHFQDRAIELGVDARYCDNPLRMTGGPRINRAVMLDLCRVDLLATTNAVLSDVVETCLCCIDNDKVKTADEGSDTTESITGLSIMLQIQERLNSIKS